MKKYFTALIIIFALAACVAPPLEDMNKAQDAVTRAENDADAVMYAPNTLIRAREALTNMQSEADAKRYDAAKNYAAEAIANAERALVEGKAGAARVRDEAANLINSLSGPLAETSSAVNAAKEVQNIQLDFDLLSQDMDTAERTYSDAQQSLQANAYREAITRAEAVRSLLSDINTRLSEAAQATSRKQ